MDANAPGPAAPKRPILSGDTHAERVALLLAWLLLCTGLDTQTGVMDDDPRDAASGSSLEVPSAHPTRAHDAQPLPEVTKTTRQPAAPPLPSTARPCAAGRSLRACVQPSESKSVR